MTAPEKKGIRRLIRKYRRKFRIPENLNHYSEEDFAEAEKRFVKLCLREGPVPERNPIRYDR